MTTFEWVDIGTRILFIIAAVVLFTHQRVIVEKLHALTERMKVVERKIVNLQGLSTLPQATRAEVEVDIRRALEPVHTELGSQRSLLEEIGASIRDVQEYMHAGDTATQGTADSSRGGTDATAAGESRGDESVS